MPRRARGDLAPVGLQPPGVEIDPLDLGHAHRDVALPGQHRADRRGDVRRVQPRRRHLVQQRLEQVVVLAIDQRDADPAPVAEGLRRVQAAEAAVAAGIGVDSFVSNESASSLVQAAANKETRLTIASGARYLGERICIQIIINVFYVRCFDISDTDTLKDELQDSRSSRR